MIAACTRVLADWGWDERPGAVVSMPSRRHPLLVEPVTRGLAEAGRRTYLGSLELVGGGLCEEAGGNNYGGVADGDGEAFPSDVAVVVDRERDGVTPVGFAEAERVRVARVSMSGGVPWGVGVAQERVIDARGLDLPSTERGWDRPDRPA